MKSKSKYLNARLFILTISFLFTVSCSDKGAKTEPSTALAPSITLLSPDQGTADTEVTIIGENFGESSSGARVAFGAKDAAIISISKQQIKVKAPSGISNVTTDVFVTVGNKASNKKQFHYTNTTPAITSMTSSCFYNSTVVITGNGFSPNKEDNIVKFGTIAGIVTAATSTSLQVKTPDLGVATSAEVTVSKSSFTSKAKSIAIDFDQNKVATYNWTTHTVKPGVTYKTGQFNLFGASKRGIYVLDIALNSSNTLGVGFSTTEVATTTMCGSYNAIAGVNAGYFPFGGASDKDPYIRINGKTVQSGHLNVSQIFTNSALLINNNVATVRKFTETHKNLNQVAALIPVAQAENIIVCGPMLLKADVVESLDMSIGHNNSATSRTGLGVTADGKRVFMVVVDSKGEVTGISTLQLAKILQALGAVDAMNLDGGGSSTMFVKDQGSNGRVNFPYGGTYQRPVRSVVYVK